MVSTDSTAERSTSADAETIVEGPDGRRLMPEDVDETGLAPGTRLGRYVVLEAIGSGGMGLVLAAYDPELNRKVALKLMRPTKSDRRREQPGQASRLLQEAQALAKLAHPNVITVYDVGTWEDRVFVAMELVEGDTLKGWLEGQRRRWSEVLSVFIPAGRGLSAAHAAGLIHRDFKPDNVLIGDDGRVRVMDFGLAAPAPATDTGRVESSSLAAGAEDPGPDLPARPPAGAVMGTPAFMAPEQHDRRAPDPRSDQYSFCVALHLGLYGTLPFDAERTATLAQHKRDERIVEPPAGSGVPSWVRRIVLRGLRADQADRWPSMDALLDALSHDPRVARRKWLGIAAGVMLAGGSLGGVIYLRSRSPDVCRGAAEALAEVWNDERRAAARGGLVATTIPGTDPAWLEQSWTKTEQSLDQYGRAWVEMSTDACEATWVRGEQSARLLGQRQQCLDQRRAELDALVGILAEATPAVAHRAFAAASSLSPLSHCADSEVLAAAVDPPQTDLVQQQVAQLRQELARARMLDVTGMHESADELATQALETATALGYAPAQAEARFSLGLIKASEARDDEAEEHLSEAHWQASSVKHDTIAAAAASALVDVVGIELARRDEGIGWARHAEAAFKRIGLSGVDEATLRHRVGATHAANRNWADAEEALEQARALFEELPRQALSLARVVQDLARVRAGQDDLDGAEALLEQARHVIVAAAGEQHPEVAMVSASRGRVADARGEPATAREHYQTALERLEQTVGDRSPLTAVIYEDLARSYALAGEHDQATAMQQRAHGLLHDALGEHPRVARALYVLGTTRHAAGRREDARRDWDQALAQWERTRGSEHPDVAYPLVELAALDLEEGHAERAVERLERALKVRGRKGLTPSLLADTQFALAKALHMSGEDRTRAQELARKARRTYEQSGSSRQGVSSIDRWLAEIESEPPEEP